MFCSMFDCTICVTHSLRRRSTRASPAERAGRHAASFLAQALVTSESAGALPGIAAHFPANVYRASQSSLAAVGTSARARASQNTACCSTIPARISARAVPLVTCQPIALEINGPATKPMTRAIAAGFAAVHLDAAFSHAVMTRSLRADEIAERARKYEIGWERRARAIGSETTQSAGGRAERPSAATRDHNPCRIRTCS